MRIDGKFSEATSVTRRLASRSRARYSRLCWRWSASPSGEAWCRARASRITAAVPSSLHSAWQYPWPRQHGRHT
jgi:hypothetical protein